MKANNTMASIAGAPTGMMIGGKTSTGPKRGIYRVKVKDALQDVSQKKGTPYLELDLFGCKDNEHPEKEGKRILKQRFYGPNPESPVEDQEAAAGRLKNSLFKPLGVKWPESQKALDERQFHNLEFFIYIDKERNPAEGHDARMEVKRISKDREALEKLIESTPATEEEVEGAPKAAKPARRAGR